MPPIVLVRHAQASYGADDYDVLSPLAELQNRALHVHLPTRGINGGGLVVVSGPGLRHRETARQLFPHEAVAIDVDEAWDEYSADEVLAAYGAPGGEHASLTSDTALSSKEFQVVLDRALRRWIEDDSGSWADFRSDTHKALLDVARKVPNGGLGLIVTSAGRIAAAAAAVLGADATFVPLNRVQVNTGLTKFIVGESGTSLVSFNDHTHLTIVNDSLITYR